MATFFERQLEELHVQLITMGSLCEKAISLSARAIQGHGEFLVRQVFETDREIDEKEREIESLCLKLLLQQQPVAKDLRKVSAALKMITDMERIGDQAADIAEITRHLAGAPDIHQYPHIPRMAQSAITMLKMAIDAFVRRDLALAQSAIRMDDVVDDLFVQLKKILVERIASRADHSDRSVDLIIIGKYLERVADHAVNIANWAIFCVTGEIQ